MVVDIAIRPKVYFSRKMDKPAHKTGSTSTATNLQVDNGIKVTQSRCGVHNESALRMYG